MTKCFVGTWPFNSGDSNSGESLTACGDSNCILIVEIF